MKGIFLLSTFVGLVMPSVLMAEVTLINCKTSQERIKSPNSFINKKAPFSEWKGIRGFVYNFKLDESKNYVHVYFPNKSFDRGTNLVKFRPDSIKFNLPKKDQGQERYILDNYDINRRNGDFLRVFKMFNSENNQLTFEMQEKGKCKKSNLKTLF